MSITIPAPLPRDLSAAELADAGLLERRRRMAAAFEADGIRHETVREYRDLGQRSPAADQDSPPGQEDSRG